MTSLRISDQRSRNWATLVYPESGDLQELLSALKGLRYAASPLHDMDVDENGEIKKPHHHVVIAFDGLKSRSQVRQLLPDFCVGVEQVASLTGYVRYLVHLDDPDKARYSSADVIASRIDVQSIMADSKSVSIADVLSNMPSLTSFRSLVDWAIAYQPAYLSTIARYSYFFNTYLKGSYVRDEDPVP